MYNNIDDRAGGGVAEVLVRTAYWGKSLKWIRLWAKDEDPRLVTSDTSFVRKGAMEETHTKILVNIEIFVDLPSQRVVHWYYLAKTR